MPIQLEFSNSSSKAYFVTSPSPWKDTKPDELATLACVDKEKPILAIQELGKSDNEHSHLFFFSSKSRNTVDKYLKTIGYLCNKFTSPDAAKYAKYSSSDEPYKGCYTYLMKGLSNHLLMSDDSTVEPQIGYTNLCKGKLETYREFYLSALKQLKDKKSDIENYRKSSKKEEWENILKDISEKNIYDSQTVINYLIDYFSLPEHNYNRHTFLRLYQRILKHVNIEQFKQLILQEISNSVLYIKDNF